MQLTFTHVTTLLGNMTSTIAENMGDDMGVCVDRCEMIKVVLDNWERFETVEEFALWTLRESGMDTMCREDLSDFIEDLAYA